MSPGYKFGRAEEGTSQTGCDQTGNKSYIDDPDKLSISSVYSDKECQRYLIGKEILRNMLVHIEDENVYLDQFKQLLQLEDYFKKVNDPCLPPLSIRPSISDIMSFSNIPPNSGITLGKDCTVLFMVGKQDFVDNNKPAFVYEEAERILRRKELFHNPKFDSSIQNLYDQTLDQLIDMEETFVE